MRNKKNKESFRVEFKGIELLQQSLNIYFEATKATINFKYLLNIQTKVDAVRKFVFKIVNIRIQNAEQTIDYGSITVSCVFYLNEFDKLVNVDSDGIISMPMQLRSKLDTDAVSTMRGVMFSEFKGTALHNAILPIMNFQSELH